MNDSELFFRESDEESEVIANSQDKIEYMIKFDPPMYIQRYSAVQQLLVNENWRGKLKTVVDFGCSEFGFFNYLKNVIGLQEILFVDIDRELLQYNTSRIYPLTSDYLCRRKDPLNIKILNGSISNPSLELMDVDAVCCIEIIEHLYPDTLDALPYNIFGVIKPYLAIFTTPNSDFNVLFPNFSGFRHYDHKFEWTRQQFEDWAYNVILRYPEYSVKCEGIGSGPRGMEIYGECSQMAVFVKQKTDEKDILYKQYFCSEQADTGKDCDKATVTNDCNKCKFCSYEQMNNFDFISYGVCTYLSYSINNESTNNIFSYKENGEFHCAHSLISYEEVGKIDYPYDIDNRTQEERILHTAQCGIYRLGGINRRYFKEDIEQSEIPLHQLTYNDGDEITVPDLSNILQKAGYQVQECNVEGNITLCVIYHPYETMSNSSMKTESTDNSEAKENYVGNWDNESQWDNESTQPEPTTEIITEAIPKKLSDAKNEVGETSGTASPKKIECLYDSGCQISSSSFEILTPELLRNMQLDKNEKKSDTIRAKSEQENLKATKNLLKRQTMNNPILHLTVMQSDGNIKFQKCNVGDVVDDIEPVLEEQNADHPPPVIENGDLANNNRDREGNNFQAAENLIAENQNVNDNAIQRVFNYEDNAAMINDEIDMEEFNLENLSQEVLFDPNSENSLSDIDLVGEQSPFPQFYNTVRVGRMPINIISSDNVGRDPSAFPAWLLHILNISESDSASIVDAEPHFYSQGDGLGIHPSISDLSTDSSTSRASIHMSNVLVVGQDTPVVHVEHSNSDNENSEDYFSVDEGNINVPIKSNDSIFEETLEFSESELRFLSNDTQENKVEPPEQSTSKKKD